MAMTLDEMTDDAIDYIYNNITENVGLSEWECAFLDSTEDQWHRKRWLSDRQKEILGQIWEKMP
jgi:hypothetical protein